MIVPILTDPDIGPGDEIQSLCYEVHGENGTFFNLISDECTSVNAYYQEAFNSSSDASIDLNMVTRIGVRARGNNSCVDVQVDLDCTVAVDGVVLFNSYASDGISVRKSGQRVRVSVPNCASSRLVMWVFCQTGQVPDPDNYTITYPVSFLRFVVTHGLNLSPESHGLIGLFPIP